MKPSKMALALWTCCSALAVTACGENRVAVSIKPDATRLVCAPAGARPKIPSEYVIDWAKVQTVDQAKAEHERYVASIRTREGIEVGYIVQIEGQLFACSNNMAWLRDYYSKLPDAK